MSNGDARELARELIDTLRAFHWHCATAESCTGGGIAAAITDIAGSSDVFDRGFVTYSDAAKIAMLSVDAALIDACGAVSEEVAKAMAAGALSRSESDCAVSVTGVAGPGGGTAAKPVGMVCFGWAVRGREVALETAYFAGDRAAVRQAAVVRALTGLLELARGTR